MPDDRDLDEHFDVSFGVITAHKSGFAALADTETSLWLQVVRTFTGTDKETDDLGFGLDASRVELLGELRIGFDVDEYG